MVWGAVSSTVQVWLAGVASVLPAASVARTSKVCAPAAERRCSSGVAGAGLEGGAVEAALEGAAGLVGRRSSKLASAPVMVALRVVVGAVVSTVQVRLAGVASVLPAASVARASKVCSPSARPV